MTKRFSVLICSIMLLLTSSHVLADDPISFGVYQNSPLVVMDESGHAQGLVIDILDAHLQALKADQASTYYYSLTTWFGSAERWHMPDWVLWVLAISICFLVFFLITSQTLRLQVRARTQNLQAEVCAHEHTEAVLRKKTRQQESMIESAHSLMESLDLTEVLERISQHTKELLNAYGVATYLLVSATGIKVLKTPD